MVVLLNGMEITLLFPIRMSLFIVHHVIVSGMAMHSALVGVKIECFINIQMHLPTILFLLVAYVAAAPVHTNERVVTMSDCNICMGVTVQIQRAPTSFILCNEPRCEKITKEVWQVLPAVLSPEKICTRIGYC